MKKINIKWFRVSYNYKRENGTHRGDFNKVISHYNIDTNNANINNLMRFFKKWARSWSGQGYVEIVSINAGPFDCAKKWAENHSSKFAGKKIKFNNLY